jgi:hypothetical protein
MRKYESWKGPEGYLKAAKIRDELRDELRGEPTKRDFCEAGKYKVWIALYRHERKSFSDKKECEKLYNRIREGLLKNERLMRKMLFDVCAILGYSEVLDIVERFRRERG